MAVPSPSSQTPYRGDGATTNFPTVFYFLANSDLVVSVTIDGAVTTLTLGTDYTVSGAGVAEGGTVTLTTAPIDGASILIRRVVSITQPTRLVSNDAFPSATMERALDRLTMIGQQQQDALDRSLSVPVGNVEQDMTLPDPASRANKLLGFGADGELVVTAPVSGSAADLAAELADGGTLGNGDALVAVKQPFSGSTIRTQHIKNAEYLSVTDFGAIADGAYHPLSERFDTLGAAQAAYPNAGITALTDSIDWAAAQQADYVAAATGKTLFWPAGWYVLNRTILKKSNWRGDGTANAWHWDGRGTILSPYGTGEPARWTDVDGADASDYTPFVVAARSGHGFADMTLQCTSDLGVWACGIFFPCVKRQTMDRVDVRGEWSDAAVRIDATWSSINTTLTALHPDVESDEGANEYNITACWLEGVRGLRIQGTTRPSTTTPFVWGWGGTSDISLVACRLGNDGDESTRLSEGAAFWHDAVMPNAAGAGQGINFVNCALRVQAKYCLYLDHSARTQMLNTYAETVNAWQTAHGSAVNACTSHTASVTLVNDANGHSWTKDGSAVGTDSLPDWAATRIVSQLRSDGRLASPNFYASKLTAVALDIASFESTGTVRLCSDDGTTKTAYLYFTSSTVRPATSKGASLGTTSFPFGVGNIDDLRIITACRPTTDNVVACGNASFRWSQVYAGTGSINTSDAREKTAVTAPTAAEIAAAKALASEMGTYQWLSAVAAKGPSAARLHIGMTVQRAIEIMTANGLDPMRYGFICHDAWPATEAVVEDGRTVVPAQAAGDHYSFRPDELALFILRGLAQRMTDLEARVTTLEGAH